MRPLPRLPALERESSVGAVAACDRGRLTERSCTDTAAARYAVPSRIRPAACDAAAAGRQRYDRRPVLRQSRPRLPVDFNLRIEAKTERDRNLRCNSLEAAQISALSGCNAGFLSRGASTSGIAQERRHDRRPGPRQRRLRHAARVRRVEHRLARIYEGRLERSLPPRGRRQHQPSSPPSSRFLTSSLPSGNYGIQAIANQFGRAQASSRSSRSRPATSFKTANTVSVGASRRSPSATSRITRSSGCASSSRVDPALFGAGISKYRHSEHARSCSALSRSLPDTLRPTRVLLYRLQFGTQPQNPNGPQFRVARSGDVAGSQTYDLLREGVDYYMDRSHALVRAGPAAQRDQRASRRRLQRADQRPRHDLDDHRRHARPPGHADARSGRESRDGIQASARRRRSSAARFARCIAWPATISCVARTQVRVVTGSGLLERPVAGSDATFLQMFGLAQSTNPAEFDFENRLWPRDERSGLQPRRRRRGSSRRPVARPGARDQGLFPRFSVAAPVQRAQRWPRRAGQSDKRPDLHDSGRIYLLGAASDVDLPAAHLRYETGVGEEAGGAQPRLVADAARLGARRRRGPAARARARLPHRLRRRPHRVPAPRHAVPLGSGASTSSYEENAAFGASPDDARRIRLRAAGASTASFNFTAINQSQTTPFNRPQLGFQSNSTLTTGVDGAIQLGAPSLTRFASRLPFGDTKTPSRFSLYGEIASSHPQFAARNQGQAYVETFDGGERQRPCRSATKRGTGAACRRTARRFAAKFGGAFFEREMRSTLVWQTNVQTPGGARLTVKRSGIDPLLRFTGSGIETNEPVLWLTLLPLDQVGRTTARRASTSGPPASRSRAADSAVIRTVLRSSGPRSHARRASRVLDARSTRAPRCARRIRRSSSISATSRRTR